MSETEDVRAVAEKNENERSISEGSIDRSGSADNLDSSRSTPQSLTRQATQEEDRGKEAAIEERKEKRETSPGVREALNSTPQEGLKSSKELKETEKSASSTDRTSTPTTTSTTDEAEAEGTASEKSERSGVAKVEVEVEGRGEGEGEREASGPEARGDGRCPGNGTDGGNGNTAVGEWNSLPVLVERLRAALELSLAVGSRRDDEPPATLPEDSGVDSEEDFRVRNSMERAVLAGTEPELKNDLKFLEDLLLSDIQTALSRLRETLERIDVAALAKHGAASDPSSKLHLLKLVSSLLSRLQVPEEAVPERKAPELPTPISQSRRRRGTRHTIGVSAEELASARRWLEEERSDTLPGQVSVAQRKEEAADAKTNGILTATDRRPEEVRDKCTKDAINQRQSLRDKNKETRVENCMYRGIAAQASRVELEEAASSEQASARPNPYRPTTEDHQDKMNETENTLDEGNEERSRVGNLAAALRQRAEMSSGKYTSTNKFTAKKSRIKRANTIDIPSYLKLQAESLGHDGTGCVSLRRPINVGDKALNAANAIVPSFQPKTENDRKFLALINKNSEAPVFNPPPPFKTLGYTKTTDPSALTNENWNSRFSNIKTTFDKPSSNEERENKQTFSKTRPAKKFPTPSAPFQPSPGYNATSERSLNANYNEPPIIKRDSSAGFRHAPSSPFRRIEKPAMPVSPTKVPPTYHWSKGNVPAPTNTLREKAKMLFDRDNVQPHPLPKTRTDHQAEHQAEHQEKSSSSRPPWIDGDRNGGRSNGTVTENGRLDYRSFCKQFAPFVGRGVESKLREFEEPRQREYVVQRRDSSSGEKNTGVVDGKISFRMLPEKSAPQVPLPRREAVQQFAREKFAPGDGRGAYEFSQTKGGYSDKEFPRANVFGDATLRGSSSVAVQTGINDEHPDEARSFRVAPKISKGPPSTCSNASVQTCSDLERPTQFVRHDTDPYERPDSNRPSNPVYHADDPRRFILDHNQNYHRSPGDCSAPNAQVPPNIGNERCFRPLDSMEGSTFRKIPHYQQSELHALKEDKRLEGQVNENRAKDRREKARQSPSSILPTASNCSRPEEGRIFPEEKRSSDWLRETPDFPDDENIQNQDISPDVGVVTRYTCAIATVASVDSPEPRSEEVGPADSRTPSSPSPSQSWSCSRSRPPTHETSTTPEDEIRRHNLLQQSLVRRLQNERTSLNESRAVSPSNFGQTASYSEGEGITRATAYLRASSAHPSNHDQPASFHEATVNRSPRFLSPNTARNLEQHPPTVPSTAGTSSTVNRVVALREAYEHTPSAQLKPIEKERSPIPNGVNPIDSSDEYLVSCATKPSRSIVLSKSESWHQLALCNSYPRAPRINVPSASSSPSHAPPKPPKPKSPSAQKFRSKQFEASSAADSVKRMEDKIRRYFDSPTESGEPKDSQRSRRSSPRGPAKGLVGLSRSRTMPGICDEKLRLTIPTIQLPLLNVNTADVDKVFDDLFEEATRTDSHH